MRRRPRCRYRGHERWESSPANRRVIGRVIESERAAVFSRILKVFCLVLPGVSFFSMRTASAFLAPASKRPVTSKRPRRKPPSMRPSFSPFRKTSAFQLIPSKFSQARLPAGKSGAVNSFRYQKSAQKNESENTTGSHRSWGLELRRYSNRR